MQTQTPGVGNWKQREGKQRATWWLAGLALAALTVWALPGRLIRMSGDQLHRLVGSSTGGTWQMGERYLTLTHDLTARFKQRPVP